MRGDFTTTHGIKANRRFFFWGVRIWPKSLNLVEGFRIPGDSMSRSNKRNAILPRHIEWLNASNDHLPTCPKPDFAASKKRLL